MLSDNAFDVVILGDAYIDFIFPDIERYPLLGEEVVVKRFELRAGGSAGYTAIALASLGLRVSIISNIGDDPLSSLWLDFLSNLDIDTTFVKIIKGSQIGVGSVFLHTNDRSFITFRGANQINREFPPSDNIDAKFLLITGFSQAPYLWQPTLIDYIKNIRQRETKIALDTNWSVGEWREICRKILQYIDFLIINEEELKKLAKSDNIYDAAQRLIDLGVHTCIIKRGKLGCTIIEEKLSQNVPTQKAEVIDLNGAGDFLMQVLYMLILKEKILIPHVNLRILVQKQLYQIFI